MLNERIVGFPIFEQTWRDFEKHKDAMIDACVKRSKIGEVESNVAVRAKHELWESDFNFLKETEEFAPFVKWAKQEVEGTLKRLCRKPTEMIMTDSWCHVTQKGGYHAPHYHGNSTWSFIFYLTTHDSGFNNFYLPFYLERKRGSEFMNDMISYPPREGNLIMFPSGILHDASPYQGDENRIIVSWNANFI